MRVFSLPEKGYCHTLFGFSPIWTYHQIELCDFFAPPTWPTPPPCNPEVWVCFPHTQTPCVPGPPSQRDSRSLSLTRNREVFIRLFFESWVLFVLVSRVPPQLLWTLILMFLRPCHLDRIIYPSIPDPSKMPIALLLPLSDLFYSRLPFLSMRAPNPTPSALPLNDRLLC